jgi:phosphonopyruvate decarboxylase
VIDPSDFLAHLLSREVKFYTGVPDSLLAEFCACVTARLDGENHVIAHGEGGAVAMAIGHHLATGHPALVYMQNSGLGNAINPITSLAAAEVYGIPMLLLIGWRAELDDAGGQFPDEPQHALQGRVTCGQLDLLGIPHEVIDAGSRDWSRTIDRLLDEARAGSRPVALVVRRQTFGQFARDPVPAAASITREAAIEACLSSVPDDMPVICTTGMASRELFELRVRRGESGRGDFLTVGGMGYALQIAVGVALARSDRRVLCLDGDGALLMQMGGLPYGARAANLVHVVINNAAHESVGAQPTLARAIDLPAIAVGCGYRLVRRVEQVEKLRAVLAEAAARSESVFIEVRCGVGHRSDLGRPTRSPQENKVRFMGALAAVAS